MGYTIRYNTKGDKGIHREEMKKTNYRWVARVMTVLLLVGALGYFGNWESVKLWLIPGNPTVTEAATRELISEIMDGRAITEAFNDFCLSIVTGEI